MPCRWSVAPPILAAIAGVLLPAAASAQQRVGTPPTMIQLEYRESIPPSSTVADMRNKIYAEILKDCDAASTAFHKLCSVTSINFTNIPNNVQAILDPTGVTARAQLMLTADPATPTPPN